MDLLNLSAEDLKNLCAQALQVLDMPVILAGKTSLSLWKVLYLIVLLAALVIGTGYLQKWLVNKLLSRSTMDIGVRQSLGAIIRYTVVALGFAIILQTAGIDLSALTVVAGALGLGLSFGLQNITTNLVSGLIILFERPIKVGDRVEVGNVTGDVVEISLRSTTVRTDDSMAIIVPNSEFISKSVINWSYIESGLSFSIQVSAPSDVDNEDVEKVLAEVAERNANVLRRPAPYVTFDELSDGIMKFSVRAATNKHGKDLVKLKKTLCYAIYRACKERGIKLASIR